MPAFPTRRSPELRMHGGVFHGVMYTHNMTSSGETIDYGPCAFMYAYDPATVFSSIDHAGRYAYGNQPQIAQWNLARLAEALLPLIDDDRSEEHTSELQSLMRISYAVFCLKKKNTKYQTLYQKTSIST